MTDTIIWIIVTILFFLVCLTIIIIPQIIYLRMPEAKKIEMIEMIKIVEEEFPDDWRIL